MSNTFATTVTLSNGVPIETVSKMLGHTSLKTTQIYARIVDTKISEDMNQLQKTLSAKDLNKPEGAGINISELNKYGMEEPNLNLVQRNITSYN